jgi:hypothetical protein
MGLKPHVSMDLGDLLIDINVNSQLSTVLDFDGPGNRWRSGFDAISIGGPGTLTGTVTVQVSDFTEDSDEYGTTWRDKQSAGVDITVPADGHITINTVDFKRLRLSSGSAEVANRRFRVRGIEHQA